MPKQKKFKQEVGSRLSRVGAGDERLWEEVQKRAFMGWVNMHLEKREMSIENLDTDFGDGVKLINLIEILHGQKIEGRYYKNPKSRPYKIDNVNFVLTFITDNLRIKLFGCSAEDIVDGNLKIILGMLWRLIQKYQLSDTQNRQSLLQWCRKVTEGFDGVEIDNIHDGFADGRALGAMLSVYDSSLIDFASLSEASPVDNLTRVFDLAEQHMNVPKLLDPTDVAERRTDDRSVLTYISMWHSAFQSKGVTTKTDGDGSRDAAQTSSAESARTSSSSKEVEALKQENAGLRSDLEYVREELAIARTALAAAEDEAKEAREELAERRDAASEAQTKPTETDAGDKPSAPTGETTEEDKEKVVSELDAKIAALKEEVSSKEAQLGKIKEELSTVDAKLHDAIDMESAATKRTEELSDAIKTKEEELGRLEKRVEDARKSAEDAESSSGDRGAAVEESPRMAADTLQEAIMAEQQLEDAQERLQEVKEELEKQEAALEKARSETAAAAAPATVQDESLVQALEDAKEEILVLKKKYEQAQAKALKKQKKKYQSRIKNRERDLKALREQADVDIKAKDDEIAILKTQLAKAQRALGEASTVDAGDATQNEDIQLLQSAYAEMLEIAKVLEAEESNTRTKQRTHNSDSEGEEDAKDE